MSSSVEPNQRSVTRFRTRLFAAMMLVVLVLTALALYFAQPQCCSNGGSEICRKIFRPRSRHSTKFRPCVMLHSSERCRELVLKPRLHAALKDNALDLLYPTAKDELRDLMEDAVRKGEGANRFKRGFTVFLIARALSFHHPIQLK